MLKTNLILERTLLENTGKLKGWQIREHLILIFSCHYRCVCRNIITGAKVYNFLCPIKYKFKVKVIY